MNTAPTGARGRGAGEIFVLVELSCDIRRSGRARASRRASGAVAKKQGLTDPECRSAHCRTTTVRGNTYKIFRRLKPGERSREPFGDAYILRVPGLVGTLAWREIKRGGKPYALEVVGDPWDALSPGTAPSLFRPVYRRVGTRDLKAMCRGAVAVHYVTQGALQRRYPPNHHAHVAGFSDALMGAAFASPAIRAERFRRIERIGAGAGGEKHFRVGFIGSLSQLYKGPDVLLRAAALCRDRGLKFETALVGDGRTPGEMKALARQLRDRRPDAVSRRAAVRRSCLSIPRVGGLVRDAVAAAVGIAARPARSDGTRLPVHRFEYRRNRRGACC